MKKHISLEDKIFIAGGSGMVGSAIKRLMIKKGYGNKKYGGKLLTPSSKELDLLNYSSVKEWFGIHKPDIVIIAAAKVGGILANNNYPSDFLLQNLKIQSNLIELSFLNKVKRLLFLGSSCIYPKFSKQPIKEESLLTGELEKTNEWYAIAKITGLKLCEALKIEKGFDAISLMPTNLYGQNDNYSLDNSHVMAAFIRKFHEAKINNLQTVTCWGSGSPLREFMHVDDLADAIIFALEFWKPAQNKSLETKNKNIFYLNVGTGEDISIKSLAEKISKKFNYKGKIIWDNLKPDGTPKKQLNIERIKNLGWSPKIGLDYGIEKTISSFKEEIDKGICRL